jgi:hypothetical protein
MKKNFSVIFLLLALVSTACFAADDTKLDAETQKQVVNKVKEYCTLMQEFSADVGNKRVDAFRAVYYCYKCGDTHIAADPYYEALDKSSRALTDGVDSGSFARYQDAVEPCACVGGKGQCCREAVL